MGGPGLSNFLVIHKQFNHGVPGLTGGCGRESGQQEFQRPNRRRGWKEHAQQHACNQRERLGDRLSIVEPTPPRQNRVHKLERLLGCNPVGNRRQTNV